MHYLLRDAVLHLEMRESVKVDPDRMVELCVSMGENGAEALVATAIENMAIGMEQVEVAYHADDLKTVSEITDDLQIMAEHVGMITFAQVADDVSTCARMGQIVPLSATLNRLRRIADKSLSAVWDMQDIPLQ